MGGGAAEDSGRRPSVTATSAPGPRKNFNDFVEGLRREGYAVKLDALVAGKSGVVHRFDLLAERAGGGKKKTIVCMKGRGRNPAEEMIGLFVMAFDVGAEPCYVMQGSVEEKLAESYGITLLTGE